MTPVDDAGTTPVLAWMPVLLVAAAFILGLVALLIREMLPGQARAEHLVWERIAYWFFGLGCGMGGLFLWWMVT